MEMFARVTDPTRLRTGDFVLCPARTPTLNVSTSTLGKWGLSIGDTCRSENYEQYVKLWMAYNLGASAPRMFLVAHAEKGSVDQEPPAYLLGFDKKVEKPGEPEALSAHLVPYVRENATDNPPEFTYGQWVGAWNKATDNGVFKALMSLHSASKTGVAVEARQGKFDALIAVWEGPRALRPSTLSNDAKSNWSTNDWLPAAGGNRGYERLLQPSAFDLGFVNWEGGRRKNERIRANKKFLKNFFAKGAIVLRPSARFIEAMTADAVRWYCGKLAERFREFAEAGEFYDQWLVADVVRAKACTRTCARMAKRKSKIADALALAEKERMKCH
jgi:hypothetical protein